MPRDLQEFTASLPIGAALPELARALERAGAVVLEAPPGAGKTTLVPLALLDTAWLGGRKIVMLEPRRLAARAAARRMAQMLGEEVGATVGFRTRLETRVSGKTRVEVITEGILPRMLASDPALEGVGIVIFDEYHERSLDADLGLALTLETKRYLREDLRLLVMSATLDGERIAALIDAPRITSAGRSFPVELRYLDRPPQNRFEAGVTSAIRGALDDEGGSILVFLPGGAEIRRVERSLGDCGAGVIVAPLYGDLPPAAQDAALAPAPPGQRRIVLATSIAETSLTIEGIRVVIDGGLARGPRFDPASGMTRLVTNRVSQAAAAQRAGRAGRLAPGIAYRLWPEREQPLLAAYAPPEIREADLAPLLLTLAASGTSDPASLAWLDPPPAAAHAQARTLLRGLGALADDGRITQEGQAMAALPLHPRLAHMALRAKARGQGRLAAAIAALLMERDVVRAAPQARDADLRLRVELLAERPSLRDGAARDLPPGLTLDRGGLQRARDAGRQIARQLGLRDDESVDAADTGSVLALAYPDRIAQSRGVVGQFRLAGGGGAELPASDLLAREEFLAVAELDGERKTARIFLAAPLSRAAIDEDFVDRIVTSDSIAWDAASESVLARRRRVLDALVLDDHPLRDAPQEQIAAALLGGIRALGLEVLPWSREPESLRRRVEFLRRTLGAPWPDFSDAALLATLDDWLAPYLTGMTRRAQFGNIDLVAALSAPLDYAQRRALDALAPSHVAVPSGSRIAVDYGAGDVPVLAVKLQEMFGATSTPAIAGGKVPLVLHLLSPAGRPLQVTRDLAGFWRNSYPQIRGEMRGRYPKHPWPDDPLDAKPTAKTMRRS
ncbi:MAG TPA: ATP-dependent helicase HrpB [Stellaceae bacterium]|jgi:ATP-dependent helicase HrpB|nr:ATP-dependent helicase HrpB [Stellaceae bacterium]